LSAVNLIERRGLDRDVAPVDAELLGDHHRQRSLDALADFGPRGNDRDLAVGRDADEGVRDELAVDELRRRFRDLAEGAAGRLQIKSQHEPAAGEAADLEEIAALHVRGDERVHLAPPFVPVAASSAARWMP